MRIHKKLTVFHFENYKQWLIWLRKNHKQPESIWLQFAKKASKYKSVTYEEAREGAIIYGWIDGLMNSLDDDFYLRMFSARRPRSSWSKINRGIAEELSAGKKMSPSGLYQVELARADGRWDAAYDSQSTIEIPVELKRFLDNNKTAKKNFDALTSANRYAFLYRIQNSKQVETKQRHLQNAMDMLKKGECFYPQAGLTVRKQAKKKK